MAAPLFLPRRAASTQPQSPPRIGGDPLARGLVSLAGLATSLTHDAVAGAWAITRSGTSPAVGVGPRGRGLESGTNSTGYISRAQPGAITTSTTQPITFRYRLFIGTMLASNVSGGLLQWASSATSSAPRYYARLRGAIPGIEFYYSTSGGVYRTPLVLQAGVEYIITHTFDGTTHSVYLNGVLQGTFAGPWNNTGGNFYIGRGYDAPQGDWIVSDFAVWSRALDAGEVKADAASPWRVLAAPQRVLPAALAASTTLVHADLAPSYAIRNLVSTDLSPSYAIRNLVSADLTPSYAVRNLVSDDLTASYALWNLVHADLGENYAVQSSSTLVANDLSPSYAIRNLVSDDLSPSYAVRNLVGANITEDYALRNLVSDDLAPSYAVRNLVSADFTAAYALTGVVRSDLQVQYAIGGTPQSVPARTVTFDSAATRVTFEGGSKTVVFASSGSKTVVFGSGAGTVKF